MVLWFNVCNKELLALRNNFRVTKKFLNAKFDCTSDLTAINITCLVIGVKLSTTYLLDDLCGTLISLVHSPLVQNFMKNLVTTLVSPIFLPLFSANNIYDGTF